MRHLLLILGTLAAFLFQSAASAQDFLYNADRLQRTILGIEQRAAEEMPRDDGRGSVLENLSESRQRLQLLRSRALRGAPAREVEYLVYDALGLFDKAMTRMGGRKGRGDIPARILRARGMFAALQQDLRRYVSRPSYQPPANRNLDDRARSLATRYLADRFRVSSQSIEVSRMTQTGNKYRVYARVSRLGSYVVTLDAVGGSVFSSEPWR